MKKIVFTLLMGLVCVSATYANGERKLPQSGTDQSTKQN